MKDIYLRASNEAELMDALASADLLSDEGVPVLVRQGFSMVIIGSISVRTGNTLTDSQGVPYPETEEVPGFHANIRADSLPDGLQGLEIPEPNTPHWEWL